MSMSWARELMVGVLFLGKKEGENVS